jgi:hypothetical protein
MDKRFLGAWLIASYATGAVAQTEEAWKTYVNSRYGYSLCYPASLFRAGAEPDADDGVTFEGPPGATLIVHGSYNATSNSLASVAANELSAVAGRPITVTYHAAKSNWAVASGIAGDRIVFTRQILKGDVMAGFEISYPLNEKARFALIVTRLSSCLK